ncbi:MAG: aminopeptidase P family protein [Bacteroidales bacterium]|nr:aminopeptidase P family protein [Bacteroidales bacterium]
MNIQDYIKRRNNLKEKVKEGIIFLSGNSLVPRNYPSNPFSFRQDSTFLYYTGIDLPDFYLIIDCDKSEEILFGNELTTEDTVWSGAKESIKEIANKTGIKCTKSVSELSNTIINAKSKNRKIHFLPPYPGSRQILLSKLMGLDIEKLIENTSRELIEAVISQRSVKSDKEVLQIENALNDVTGPMHIKAMQMAQPGIYEYEIVAEMNRMAKLKNIDFAYPVICSVYGEILHNDTHGNKLQKGQLLLIDAGAENQLHYASDITRTTPVGGKFDSRQKAIYEIVLNTQEQAIESVKPGVKYLDIHIEAAKNITSGLKDLGLIKGNIEEAVQAGAHALFFPHGLGHMLGLDVHDMEDLGENLVGYDKNIKRSSQFGTAYLRLARTLEPGFVITVEPGIYFIPQLISLWRTGKKFNDFINYPESEKFLDFGGIRIEDNVLVINGGHKVLGNKIPKSVTDIENISFTIQ